MKLTRRKYLEDQIEQKENEIVAMTVEYDLATRMSIAGKHVQQFEKVQMTLKSRMEANKQVIEVFKEYLEKEK